MDILKIRADKNSEWTVIPAIVGPTPEKGVDYYTEEEKQEIIDEVLLEVPNIAVPNATTTVVGGITIRVDGDTLYIRNDGVQA